jgi:hypothetical protein
MPFTETKLSGLVVAAGAIAGTPAASSAALNTVRRFIECPCLFFS